MALFPIISIYTYFTKAKAEYFLLVISDKILIILPVFRCTDYSENEPITGKGDCAMILRERYMNRIRPFIGSDLIKVMKGMRRSGKSVMLELIREQLLSNGVSAEHCITINFEDMRNSHLCTAQALHDEILWLTAKMDGKVYLFFDEIQEVDGWEKCFNSFRVEMDCDIYITGSNEKLLSGELVTYLGGRYIEFVIYPFSFEEFIQLYRTVFPEATPAQCFQKYPIASGMPYLSNLYFEAEPCRQYLTDLINSVQFKDIVRRGKIRDVELLERIVAYVMANIGTTFSATSLVKYFKSEQRVVSAETVLNYIKYCAEAYLFYQVKRQDLQSKQILSTNEKYYIWHSGSGLWQQYVRHQPSPREHCLFGAAAPGLSGDRRQSGRQRGRFCLQQTGSEAVCEGDLSAGLGRYRAA